MNNYDDTDKLLLMLFICFSLIAFYFGVEYGKTDPQVVYEKTEPATTEESPPVEATTEAVEPVQPKIYKIVIDPGHGGNDSGAYFHSDEGKVNEKTVNMKIARYMKEALEQYANVEVVLTRDKDKYLSLDERAEIAVANGADLVISLHNNSLEDAGGYASGSSICVAMGNYKEELGLESQKLGCNFVYELSELGIHANGLVMRSSKDNVYENGRAADYYSIIRNAMEHDITAVIVEHAFLDNENDFYDFLSSKEQLQKLGEADARAVARYLQLQRIDTGEILPSLSNYRVKIHHIKKSGHTKKFHRYYYQ